MPHNFERFQLQPFLINGLNQDNISLPTEIQERIIPAIMKGEDVIGRSKTGTGKTLAFLLPLLSTLDLEKTETQVIITAPTRELAGQLYDVLKAYSSRSETPITTQLIVGGTDRLRMIDKVKQQPHVIVGTPGRILDMMREHAIHPAGVRSFVVDEADQMLDMGFLEDVDTIASLMDEQLQMLVFSATLPEKLQPFLKKYLNQPKHVDVQPKVTSPENMTHWLISDRDRDRTEALIKVTEALNPFLAIVFVNTKENADHVFKAMLDKGMNVDCIHGDIAPRNRKKVLKKLENAEVQYVVATDLVARGIDIKGVSHIINYEIPKELEYYIHRAGRTARAGWEGLVITLYGREDEQAIKKLEQQQIEFTYKEIKHGEWRTIEKRQRPIEPQSEYMNAKAKAILNRKEKVKPGYKKKKKHEADKQIQRNKRIKKRK